MGSLPMMAQKTREQWALPTAERMAHPMWKTMWPMVDKNM